MSAYKSDFLQVLAERGFIHQVSDADGLDAKAAAGPVTAYVGFDATAPSLHIGNLLTISWFLAQDSGAPFFSTLASLDFGLVTELMRATFAPMDLLFYAIAAYCGFRYAIVPAGAPS